MTPFAERTPEDRDLLRGTAWEQKWRGTLEEYPSPEELDELAESRRGSRESVEDSSPPSDWGVLRIGLGTFGWKYDSKVIGSAAEVAVLRAQRLLIDTAEGYGFGRVETELGKLVRKNPGWPLFLASKVSRTHLSEQSVINAGKRSADRLGSPIGLYQIHWPNPRVPLEATLAGIAALREDGIVHRVGVCNFDSLNLGRAIRIANRLGFKIESNQIRLNPRDAGSSEYLVGYCGRVGVRVIAYSPIAQGSLARKAAESLGWVLDQGADYVIPRTNNPAHARENLALLDQLEKRGDPVGY